MTIQGETHLATYVATMMHGKRDGEGAYSFEGEPTLIQKSAMGTLRAFMTHIDDKLAPRHADWKVNAVMKNAEHSVVTALGTLTFEKGGEQPFVCLIHRDS